MASASHVAEARHQTRRLPTKLAQFGGPKEVKLVRLTDLHPEEGIRLGKIADDLPRIEPVFFVQSAPYISVFEGGRHFCHPIIAQVLFTLRVSVSCRNVTAVLSQQEPARASRLAWS